MIIEQTTKEENLLFIPLGGCNEIGMNLNVFSYKKRLLLIDCGSGFTDETLPGVDIMVPNFNFLKKNKANIEAIVLTHAHEDHVGGMPFIWPHLECDIYTTLFTANFLKNKFIENGIDPKDHIKVVQGNDDMIFGDFTVKPIVMTHSCPEMHAMYITTPTASVLHTGDWKLDNDPVLGNVSDMEALKKVKNPTAMICDSTNIFSEGSTCSEGELKKSLIKIVKESTGLVIITTFASNIARLQSCFDAAEASEKQLLFLGRSIHRILRTAKDSGYFNNIPAVIEEKDFKNHDRSKILVVCTGSQGEPMAALPRVINDANAYLKFKRDDTVIFSSKRIPGNEKRISSIQNKLVLMGVNVISSDSEFVHVSGHAYQEELKTIYDIVKPKVAIPVHGEPMHTQHHCKMAKKWGVPQQVHVKNGDVIRISEKKSEVIGSVESGYLALDGKKLTDINSSLFTMRKNISSCGALFIAFALGKNNKISGNVSIAAPGCFDISEEKHIFAKILKEIFFIMKKGNIDLKKSIQYGVRNLIKKELSKQPRVFLNIINIS